MENLEEKILNEILTDTFTLESFKKRSMALKLKLEKEIFKSSESSKAEEGNVSLKASEDWVKSFDSKLLEKINGDNFREIFDGINKFISETATLTIYFVFIADDDQIKEIGGWLRKSLNKPQLIFDVKVDPGLIGGCAIAYNGVYKDYSLKAKIGVNREQVMEEFRRYLKQ